MFSSTVRFPVNVTLDYDPAADVTYPLWRCPTDVAGAIIKSAIAVVTAAVNASTANYFTLTLQNGGTAGTATTSISSTIGGTAGWAALVAKSFTISTSAVAAGELINLAYDETGTGTFGVLNVQLDIAYK